MENVRTKHSAQELDALASRTKPNTKTMKKSRKHQKKSNTIEESKQQSKKGENDFFFFFFVVFGVCFCLSTYDTPVSH